MVAVRPPEDTAEDFFFFGVFCFKNLISRTPGYIPDMVEVQYEQDIQLALSTLGAGTALKAATKIDSARLNGFRIAKVNIAATLRNKTASEGPIVWGLQCNMSAAEIKAALEADPQDSTADDDKGDGQWLKILGFVGVTATDAPLTSDAGPGATAVSLAARMMEVKVNWSVIEGKDFSLFAFNIGSGALTTGTIIDAIMEIFGVWLRD